MLNPLYGARVPGESHQVTSVIITSTVAQVALPSVLNRVTNATSSAAILSNRDGVSHSATAAPSWHTLATDRQLEEEEEHHAP